MRENGMQVKRCEMEKEVKNINDPQVYKNKNKYYT